MPTVKNVGEPCAGKSHARFDAAAGGNQASRTSTGRAAPAPPADPTTTPGGRSTTVRSVDEPLASRHHGEIAQLVEHTTENRGVPGSSPGLAILESGSDCSVPEDCSVSKHISLARKPWWYGGRVSGSGG